MQQQPDPPFRFAAVRYQVRDVERSVAFYTQHLGFEVKQRSGPAFARVTALKQAGIRFRNEIETGPGGKQIQLEDPDGNPVELFEPAQ
jgi:glyoxylase I family protein